MKNRFGSMLNYLPSRWNNILGGLRTSQKDTSVLKPVFDVIDIEIKMTVITGEDVKKIMFDGILSDETLLMVYKDLERGIKNGDETRGKSKKGSSRTA